LSAREQILNPVKFVVYGVPRVGSNFFISQLNCHPDILCHYEIFHRNAIYDGFADKSESSSWLEAVSLQERNASPEKFQTKLFEEHYGYTHVGYNLFPGQNDIVLKCSIADPNLKKIILKRKNIIENYISFRIAVKTKIWSSKDAKDKGVDETRIDKRVRFEREEFIQHVRRINRFYDNLENNITLRQNEYLAIYYEDLLRDRQAVLDRVYDFLDVKQVMLSEITTFDKQNKEELRELVINYEELETFLSEEYHDFFLPKEKKWNIFSRSQKPQNNGSVKCEKKFSDYTPQKTRRMQAVKIDIHIGTEKSGTSSIQASLMQAKNDLRKAGILFPESLNVPNNTYLAIAFQSDDVIDDLHIQNNVMGMESLIRFRKHLLLAFEEELSRSDYRRVVISSEHLSSRMTTVEEVERLKEFLSQFGSDISIYFYLRPQDEFYISHYSTAVKIGETSNVFAFPSIETVREDMFYDRLVARWASVFGREHVYVHSYERTNLVGGDVVKDFWHWLQLPESIRPTVKKFNPSLDVKKLTFMRYFNTYVPRFVNNKLNQIRGNIAATMDLIESMGTKIDVSEKERASFLALFDEGNQKVATEYFGREWLFTPKTANMCCPKKTVEDELLTARDAVKIAAALWRILQEKIIKKEQQLVDLRARNRRCKEQNKALNNSIDTVARYSVFRHPLKKWRAYKMMMKNYRHSKPV